MHFTNSPTSCTVLLFSAVSRIKKLHM